MKKSLCFVSSLLFGRVAIYSAFIDIKKIRTVWYGYLVVSIFTFWSNGLNAATFSYDGKGFDAEVYINGEIKSGDYSRFIKTITEVFDVYTRMYEMTIEKNINSKEYLDFKKKTGDVDGLINTEVIINSNGGDLSESIKIGRAIRQMGLKTKTSNASNIHTSCNSACFFIWAAGIERTAAYANHKRNIGVHRVYFDKDSYKKLASDVAEKKYSKAQKNAVNYLVEMGIPEYLANKTFKTASNEVYYLSEKEIDDIEGTAPYYDELLIAKCGSYTEQEKVDYVVCKGMLEHLEDFSVSKQSSIKNKCNSISPGYLKHLEKSYMETEQCRILNNKIETWKRMKKFLSTHRVEWL